MSARILACVATMVLLGGCVTRYDRPQIRTVSSPTMQRLACPLRLAEVVDARPTQEAGMLGSHAFSLANAAASIGEALKALGWSTSAEARPVTVTIKKLYVGGERSTRIGVAALEVQPQGLRPFLVRGQAAQMNWTASQTAAAASLTKAVDGARDQLAVQLNQTCSASGG